MGLVETTITRKGSQPWAAVPFSILERKDLTPTTRLVAAWIIGKPPGWEVRITYMLECLGLSRWQWTAVKKQLAGIGAFRQVRTRGAGGLITWACEFDADALITVTIVKKTSDGELGNKKEEVYKEESSRQRTEAKTADAVLGIPAPIKTSKRLSIDDLKRLHIGYVLNDLGIEWWNEGKYVKWGDYFRARCDSGRWLWVEADGTGDTRTGGSAIDLIAQESSCTTPEAISQLRAIYLNAIKQAKR